MKIERFEDLEIWMEARKLCKIIFDITSTGAFEKDYKFKYQMRSAGGSIMDNVAEGFGRGGNKEFINFLSIAKGSSEEVKSQTYRAFDFNYISEEKQLEILQQTDRITRMLANLIKYLRKSDQKGLKFD